MRKDKRNNLIVEYRHSHPDLSLQEIADVFSISRQRVWAILKGAAGDNEAEQEELQEERQ